MDGFDIRVRGCRGSVPVSGPSFHRYGGATTSFEIEVSETRRVLIDAGTGALSMVRDLPSWPVHFSVILTHMHWDHCLALPFFGGLYDPRNRFDFYGRMVGHMDIEEAIDRVMRPPWFPVNFRSTAAERRFHHIEAGVPFAIEGMHITPVSLHHPDGVTGYRMEYRGATLVIATDVEHGVPESDEALRKLAQGADVLFYDAQYLPGEYEDRKVGWGHSTWAEGVKLAHAADVGTLVLTSHDPSRTDDQIDELLASAQAVFPNTIAAVEGETIRVAPR